MRNILWAGWLLLAAFSPAPAARAEDPPRAPISRTPPIYPELAKKMRIWGQVMVEVTVLPDGSVAKAKAIDGHPLLQGGAERAILRWRFAPGPRQSTFLVAVVFKLDP